MSFTDNNLATHRATRLAGAVVVPVATPRIARSTSAGAFQAGTIGEARRSRNILALKQLQGRSRAGSAGGSHGGGGE